MGSVPAPRLRRGADACGFRRGHPRCAARRGMHPQHRHGGLGGHGKACGLMPAKGWRMENREPVARARGLAADITAAADAAENSRRIPEPLLAQLHQARLFRMLLPCSVGGDETPPTAYLAAIEEIARHDASIAWNVFVANSTALIAAYLAPNVAR